VSQLQTAETIEARLLRVRKAFAAREWTFTTLAKKIRYTPQHVHQVLTGSNSCSERFLEDCERVLELSKPAERERLVG